MIRNLARTGDPYQDFRREKPLLNEHGFVLMEAHGIPLFVDLPCRTEKQYGLRICSFACFSFVILLWVLLTGLGVDIWTRRRNLEIAGFVNYLTTVEDTSG